uniref:Uncharacterized protein n=1 Tax=Rhizophora mucronata TaxID=61149 RepID=A0A2P2NTJ4_RHIMU
MEFHALIDELPLCLSQIRTLPVTFPLSSASSTP